jgi:hypothetical protein
MRRFHVAAGVKARTARGCAKLIDDVLANFLQRIFAVTDEKFCEALVGYQAADEIVNHGGNCVVSPETVVERLLVLSRRAKH